MALVAVLPTTDKDLPYVPSAVVVCIGCGQKCWMDERTLKWLKGRGEKVEPICPDCITAITPSLPGGN